MKLLFLSMILFISASCWSQQPVYYYQGNHKVQATLRTDILEVKTTSSASSKNRNLLQSVLPSGTKLASTHPHGMVISTNATNLNDLASIAQIIAPRLPESQIYPILQSRESQSPEDYQILTNEISFRLKPGQSSTSFARSYNLINVRPVSYAPNTYIASTARSSDLLQSLNTANTLQETGAAEWASPLIERQHHPRLIPNDPFFINQWHLNNTGSNTTPSLSGTDLNVLPAWLQATGAGINIAITDDGLETSHPDLMAHVRHDIDRDFNSNDDDPNPFSFHSHGTACAGVAAAVTNNNLGVSGVAPDSSLVGLRLIAAPTTDAQDAEALTWKSNESNPLNQIYVNSNSWGPPDNGLSMLTPGPLTESAFEAATSLGRNGKGTIFTWACGNGRTSKDNVNRDGWANSPYVIAVSATNGSGTISSNSESGSAILINAPSSSIPGGSVNGITTTDLTGISGASLSDYRNTFGGTSAATPAVAGVVALVLQANPALTYRDVMHLLVKTATKNDPGSATWNTNGAGLPYSHDYGFGRVNAGSAVTMSQTWTNKPPLVKLPQVAQSFLPPLGIPDNSTSGTSVSFLLNPPNLFSVEHVELEVDITHTACGDLKIELESPQGTKSQLMESNTVNTLSKSGDQTDNISNWRFRSVAFWDENPAGIWKVVVSDQTLNDTGSINSLILRVQGHEVPTSHINTWDLY